MNVHTSPKAYKSVPSVNNSKWYKEILNSQLAGAFDFSVAKMRKGTEPPPHVHTRDDEFLYIHSGSMHVYAEGQQFDVGSGESMFLPKGKPHAFLIQSEIIEMTTLTRPVGFMGAVNEMNEPTQAMTLPPNDGRNYATWTSPGR